MAKAVEIGVSFKVEKSDADKAEKNLKGRFDKIGKTFGNSLIAGTKSFLASSAAGAVAAIFSNPYERLAGRVDQTLEEAAGIQDRAEQYGVSGGELLKEQKTAQIYGVQDFDALLSRFANLWGKAKTGENPYLSEFTGAKNVLDAYNQVIESLRNMKGEQREVAAQKIFGEAGARQLSGLLSAPIDEIRERRMAILDAALGGISRNEQTISVGNGKKTSSNAWQDAGKETASNAWQDAGKETASNAWQDAGKETASNAWQDDGKITGTRLDYEFSGERETELWSQLLEKAADLKAKQENLQIQRETAGFAERIESLNESFLQKQNEIATKQIERETAQIRNIETFAKMADSTEEIKTTLVEIQTKLIPALDSALILWNNIFLWIKDFAKKRPWWK